MLRVKCAHCGAGNNNATEADACFQCGNILGTKPPSRHYDEQIEPAVTVDISNLAPNLLSTYLRPASNSPKDMANYSQRKLALAAATMVLVLAFAFSLIEIATR